MDRPLNLFLLLVSAAFVAGALLEVFSSWWEKRQARKASEEVARG